MEYHEEWAVSLERIQDFFLSLEDTRVLDCGINPRDGRECNLICGQCRIKLTFLPPRPLGPVQVPYTLVEMAGDGEPLEKLHRKFFLRFISAGG